MPMPTSSRVRWTRERGVQTRDARFVASSLVTSSSSHVARRVRLRVNRSRARA
jgi:hypothetical protein